MDHTGPGHTLEELLDLRGARDELVIPEVKIGIFYEFDEGDEQSPGMGPVDNEAFEENAGDLFLNGLGVGLGKQVEKGAAEVMSV